MGIIKITTGIKGLNYQIDKSYYQCYSGRRTDYSYAIFRCSNKGREQIAIKSNLKNSMEFIDKDKAQQALQSAEI